MFIIWIIKLQQQIKSSKVYAIIVFPFFHCFITARVKPFAFWNFVDFKACHMEPLDRAVRVITPNQSTDPFCLTKAPGQEFRSFNGSLENHFPTISGKSPNFTNLNA